MKKVLLICLFLGLGLLFFFSDFKQSKAVTSIISPHKVIVDGPYAYLYDEAGFFIANVSDPTHPFVLSSLPLVGTFDKDGSAVVMAKGIIIDVSNPTVPKQVGTFSDIGREIAVRNGYAYLLDTLTYGNYYLKIVNYSNPTQPVFVSQIPLTGYPTDIALQGNYAYIAASDFLLVVDISQSSNPKLVTTASIKGQVITTSPGFAYIDWTENTTGGLKVVDLSSPTSPRVVSTFNGNCYYQDFKIQNNIVYASLRDIFNRNFGMQLIDVSNPSAPVRLSGVRTYSAAFGVEVSGNFAYVADGTAGLQIVDVTDPLTPLIVGNLSTNTGISITKSVDKVSAVKGDALVYTLSYENPTAITFANVRVEDNIPVGTTYIAGSATNGAFFDGVKIRLDIGNLSSGASGSFSFKVKCN